MNKKSTFKKVLVIALVALVGLSVLGYFIKDKKFVVPKKENISDVKQEEDNSANPYQTYLNNSQQAITQLSPEKKADREKIYSTLKATPLYKTLIDSSIISMEYIPVLNAISNGISFLNKDGFSIDETIIARVGKDKDGEAKISFITSIISLATTQNGGVPKEIITLLSNYKNKFRMFNAKGIWVDADGKKSNIEFDYDLSAFFGMIDPKNSSVLNSIYEAKQKGLSYWGNIKNATYPFLNSKTEYMSYVKQVYPESPYILKVDFEITASDLYSEYNANEVAAEEKFKGKKIAVTGIVSDIRKDFAGNAKVSLEIGILQTINCNFGKNTGVVSKLNKQDKITVLGTCKGFIVKQVVMDNCEVF